MTVLARATGSITDRANNPSVRAGTEEHEDVKKR
jgi:hypothetical protein